MGKTLATFLLLFGVSLAYPGGVPPTDSSCNYDEEILGQMKARFYIGRQINEYVDMPMTQAEQLMDRSEFSKSRKTVFLVHGYTESVTDNSVVTMVNAYLNSNANVNLVAIDWSPLAQGDYLALVAGGARKVGESMGIKIKAMVDKGLDLSLMHLVGHSLGGHVSGFTGKALISTHGLKLDRITALDPAGPGFSPLPSSLRLDASDASTVDAILTDPQLYGYSSSIGSANFWPNPGSKFQPGCPDVPPQDDESFCSHRRSWMYWSESLATKDAFQGYNKDGNTYATMGEAYDGRNKGDFRLKTNSQSPFGMGEGGIIE